MPHVPPTLVLRGLCAFAFVDDVSVSITRHPAWTDGDVVAYLEEITALGQRVAATAALTQFQGEMFGPRHRKVVVDWLASQGISIKQRACLITDSTLLRGGLTAYAWMTGNETSAYGPRELDAAAAWVCRGARARPADVVHAFRGNAALLGRT